MTKKISELPEVLVVDETDTIPVLDMLQTKRVSFGTIISSFQFVSSSNAFFNNYRDVVACSTRPSTSMTSFVRAAMFEFNPSIVAYAGSGTRTIKLRVIAETTGPLMTIQLYNVTTSTAVVGSSLTSTSLTPELLSTDDLTSNLSAGSALYEVQIKMASGLPADVVNLDYAGLRLEWA